MKSKKNQRLLALILSMVLMLSASISAMAEGDVQTEASGTETTENQAAVQSLEEETVPETEALTEETDTQSAEILEEPVQESAEQEITEEPAENTETPAETTEPVQEETGEPAETTETDQTIVQSPEVQEESAVTEEQPAETTEEVITEETAVSEAAELKQEFTDENGKVTQTITAYVPEGAFQATADQISMEVSFLNTSDTDYIKGMMEELLPENYYLDGYVLYQIDFKVDGEITQPAKAVTITMSGNDLAVEDTQKAHVFYYDPENPEVEGDKDQLAEVIQKDQLIKSLQESGQSTGNIEDYDYSEIAVNDGNADTITVKGWESTIYGCYVEKEAEPVELKGKAEDIQVTLSGPASSFPQEGELALSVKKVDKETKKIVKEAIEEEAENNGQEVVDYTALDITLLHNGEEIQPLGPVNVTFTKQDREKDAEEVKETKVFHVDEEKGTATDMEAAVNTSGEAEIETTHFSVYVVVDLDQLGGQIELTVQHWAQMNKLADVDGTGTTGLELKGGVDNNERLDATATLKTDSIFTEIYSPDTLTLDNTRKITVKELSKIYQANVNKEIKNYNLTAVWVLKAEGNQDANIDNVNDTEEIQKHWTIYNVPSDEEEEQDKDQDVEISLKGDAVIRMIYTPFSKDDALQQEVKFWDYNVTQKDNRGSHYFSTDNTGINNATNYVTGSAENRRIAVGQASNGIFHDYAEASLENGERINMTFHNDKPTLNMVQGVSQDGPVYNDGLTDPRLFNDKDASGKKIVDGYSLSFNQDGDTYTLSSVRDEEGNATVENLEEFRDVYDGTPEWSKVHKSIYSNNFWPLDSLEEYEGKDIHLGETGTTYYITGNRYTTSGDNPNRYEGWREDRETNLESDDGKAHNWFFGMRYDFEFTLGDYTGPLNYYFRGDDDFWLFIDGKLAIDLGGIHSAVGETLDLRQFMEKNQMTDPDQTHRLTIIYAERGGSGSTCYMQFTIPNVTPVDVDTTVEKTNITVHKNWEDHGNPNRPSSIQVKLFYRKQGDTEWKEAETNATKTLTEGTQWTAVWTGLPKEGYEYKVEEVGNLEGYEVVYPNNGNAVYLPNNGSYEGTITNKADPSTWITVTKKWDDGELANDARPDYVEFFLYYREVGSTAWLPYPTDGRLRLTDKDCQNDGTWQGVYKDLPVYGADNEKVEYTVKEVEGSTELGEGTTLPGKGNYKYIVHYSSPEQHYAEGKWKAYEAKENAETLHLIVENSLGMEIQITKEWKGYTPVDTTVIYAGLYKNNQPVVSKWVELTADNWTDSFEYLIPATDYSVKELRRVENGEKAEFEIEGVGYTGVDSGEEMAVGDGGSTIKYVVSYSKLTQDVSDPSLSTVTITNQAQWQLIKYSSSSADKTYTLKGAKFELKHNNNTVYTGVSNENGIVEWKKGNDPFTDAFPGGTYTLTETEAPNGYMLGKSVTFTMKDGVPEDLDNEKAVIENGILTFYYANETLYVLPSSGGPGIYRYLFGGILLMMAASLIVYKNKRGEVLERK